MNLDPGAPVGQFVAERLERAAVFDRLGIDYCCHGQTPLTEACAQKGLDVQEVLGELSACDAEAAATEEPDFRALTLSALADHIEATHHAFMRRELPRLEALLSKVCDAHAGRHPELREVAEVYAGFKEEIESHLVKEERVLFPMVKQLEAATSLPRFHCGSVQNPIRVMEHEHDDAGAALSRMRALTGGFTTPPDGCASYQALMVGLAALGADLHRHIHKENNILFPRARAVEAALAAGADS